MQTNQNKVQFVYLLSIIISHVKATVNMYVTQKTEKS